MPIPAAAEDLEELELDLLLTAVARRYGYDFRDYSPASLKRRVRRAMRVENVPTLSALQDRLLHDPGTLGRFVSALSVHVTGMFRDPPVYRAIRERVIPRLRTWPFVRVWHAGCSTGEEVYSLVILLEEEGLADRCRVYATDLSTELLERARRGIFSVESMRERETAYREAGGRADLASYFTADDRHAVVRDELRRRVVFSQHNLVSDSSFNQFHLVLCRNVMIYFDRDLRDRVWRLIDDSLVTFGVLVLGSKESLRFSPLDSRYEAIGERLRLYRKMR